MIEEFIRDGDVSHILRKASDQATRLNSDCHSVNSPILLSNRLSAPIAQHIDTSSRRNDIWCNSRDFPDRESNILKMVLALALGQKEAHQVASVLLSHYHTFAEVVHAHESELRNLCGMTPAALEALRTVSEATSHLVRQKVTNRPKISCDQSLVDYLTATTQHERIFLMKVFFLDIDDRLISEEILGRGSIDHLTVYPREVVIRCLKLDAINIMIVFFHPGSSLSPNHQELTAAINIAVALRVFEVRVRHCFVFAQGSLAQFYHNEILEDR